MKSKISNQFMMNYLIVFLLSVLAALFVAVLLSFTSGVISKTLVKNIYPASLLMRDDYSQIDAAPVIQNGGGVQVINENYKVVYSAGIDTFGERQLTAAQFTDFLVQSKSKGTPYHYDIVYNPQGKFWLIVTFPTSIRLDFAVVYNQEFASKDMQNVAGAFIAFIIFYLLMLVVFAVIYSRVTSVRITGPLQKLLEGTQRLRQGDYTARVKLNLKNEFAELQDTFNDMAERIESETALRKQSEDSRKKLILDISHDLKNPLASIMGYAELCLKKMELSIAEHNSYIQIIYKNSQRANRLLTSLFELARVESPEFTLKLDKTDVCEYLRQTCGELLTSLEQAGFAYDFNIPDGAVFAMIDTGQMSRVFHNLADNAVRYNPKGTSVYVGLFEKPEVITILFKDDGVGIPAEVRKDIFKPFVRADASRNSQTGGTGLGLSIARKIVQAHSGSITLLTETDQGCAFEITLPKL